MDSMITAAAQALAAGDPLGALKRVALREDPPALALRAIAMAQLGDLTRARILIRKAARAFGPKEPVARARCVVAEAEIAFAARELNWPTKALESARITLDRFGDLSNAAHARYLLIRRSLLIGRLDDVERALAALEPRSLPANLKAVHELIVAGLAVRRMQTKRARAALVRARRAAEQTKIHALVAEVESASQNLSAPAARLIEGDRERLLVLEEVAMLSKSRRLIVDACRFEVRDAHNEISLASRPILFALARMLAHAWPEDVPRETLIAGAFRMKSVEESYRARLRVEIGRLRKAVRAIADVRATSRGFVLQPHDSRNVAVLARPIEEEHAAVLAMLADGESWSSSALAMALGTSQRTMQRALDSLAATGKIQPLGHGRARRWVTAPLPGFATTLLLPPSLPAD